MSPAPRSVPLLDLKLTVPKDSLAPSKRMTPPCKVLATIPTPPAARTVTGELNNVAGTGTISPEEVRVTPV